MSIMHIIDYLNSLGFHCSLKDSNLIVDSEGVSINELEIKGVINRYRKLTPDELSMLEYHTKFYFNVVLVRKINGCIIWKQSFKGKMM